MTEVLIPARQGRAVRVPRGAAIDVINTHGTQAALRDIGLAPPPLPSPLNLFMHLPWSPDGSLRFESPVSRPGDLVRLRAETDLVVIMSACPQDLTPVNGAALHPADVHFLPHPPGSGAENDE